VEKFIKTAVNAYLAVNETQSIKPKNIAPIGVDTGSMYTIKQMKVGYFMVDGHFDSLPDYVAVS
jgi:hypothetical protein